MQIARGQRWERASPENKWTDYGTFTHWTVLILMYQLFLRRGEIVESHVVTHTAKRPWTRDSVKFFAGDERLVPRADGRPDARRAEDLTHVLLDAVPDKTNAQGSRDPFVLKVFTAKQREQAGSDFPAFLFDGGRLIWILFQQYPVPAAFAGWVPLFCKTHAIPPALATAYHANDFARGIRQLGASAIPRIPTKDEHGRVLGGHCMRGAAANACMRMGATVVDVCKMARWQMAAWVRARGYDYTRQRLGDTAGVATAMMLNILAATPTDARLTASRREQQLDYTVALVAFGAAVGMVIVGAIVYWPEWAPSIFATHPDSTPDGDKSYAPDYPPNTPSGVGGR